MLESEKLILTGALTCLRVDTMHGTIESACCSGRCGTPQMNKEMNGDIRHHVVWVFFVTEQLKNISSTLHEGVTTQLLSSCKCKHKSTGLSPLMWK